MRTKLRDTRTKLRGKFTLFFITCALLVAIPAVAAIADTIQDNIKDNVSQALNLTAGDANSKPTAEVQIVGNNAQQDPDSGCNFDTATESLTIKFNTPTGVTATALDGATATPGEMKFAACGVDQTVQFTASSSAAAGNYTVTANVVTNGTNGTFVNEVQIPIKVSPSPDSTPPVINSTLNPANADGSNGWYKSNVSLTWGVTDPESAVTKTGCVDQNITTDQQATTYSCSAASAGGSAAQQSVTIKRDATPPTNVQFVGGPNASGSYAFGNVPNEPTCTADDATSTVDTCVVSGYSNAVGEQTLTATATDKAGNKTTATRNYTVTKADPTITWNAPAAIDYGTALNATQLNATANVVGTFAYTPETGTVLNAGTHTLSVQFTPNDTTSYNSASETVSLTVNKVDATIKVDGYTGTYDGNAHGASGTATGVNNENLSNLLNLGASFTNAPGGTANWSFEGNTNYNSDSGTAAIVIDKADATIKVDGYTGTYDGNAHGATGTATGVGGADLNSLLHLGASFTNVPGGTANWTFDGNTNYKSGSGSVAIVINKATANVQLSGLGPYIYDGTLKSATATTSTPAGLNVTITYNGSTTAPTNVGSYNVVATVDNPNYQGQATGTLVIKPWTLNGFYQPIDMGDVLNTVKNGSTVPVKFELFSGATELTSTSAVSSISAKQVNCAAFSGDPVDEIEYLAPTGGTSLRYDATAGQFIYNWATPKKANTCYSLTMTATDGSTLTAYFKLR
jgi:hypothetical protein